MQLTTSRVYNFAGQSYDFCIRYQNGWRRWQTALHGNYPKQLQRTGGETRYWGNAMEHSDNAGDAFNRGLRDGYYREDHGTSDLGARRFPNEYQEGVTTGAAARKHFDATCTKPINWW